MQKHLRVSELPEPLNVKSARTMLIEMLKMVDQGQIADITVLAEGPGGNQIMATTGTSNIYTLLGFGVCHLLDRAMDAYMDQVYGEVEDGEEEDDDGDD